MTPSPPEQKPPPTPAPASPAGAGFEHLVARALAHDIRSPLGAALLQAHLAEHLLSRATVGPAERDGLAAALAEVARMIRETDGLVVGYLEMGRLSGPPPVGGCPPVAVTDVLAEAARGPGAAAARKGLSLATAVAPPGLRVRVNRLAVGCILSNLLGNAVKYTHAGGVRAEAHACLGDLVVVVSDTGPGIASDALHRVFDEYVRAGGGDGFGLGLPIARALAGRLGGVLTAESEPGTGSRFTLRVPAPVAGEEM